MYVQHLLPIPSYVQQKQTSGEIKTEVILFGFASAKHQVGKRRLHGCLQNKTNSAVQLKHIPTGIVVKSQATRSRSQNRKLAREILAQRIDELTNGDQSRSAIVGAVKKKRADSAAKKSRRKYKLLEEEKAAAAAAGADAEAREAEVEASEAEAEAETLAAKDSTRVISEQSSDTGQGAGSQPSDTAAGGSHQSG